MATILENHNFTYQVIFNKMRTDLITVTKYEVFADEMDTLEKLHMYWNDLVRIAFRWKNIAEKELPSFKDKKRIKLHLKDILLRECERIIKQISNLCCERYEFFVKKAFLVDELSDRLLYIKKTF